MVTAIATVGAGEAPETAAEQLALLPAAPGETLAEPVASGERRIGRPPGARNRRTSEMLAYLYGARGYKTPLEWLTELYSKPTAEVVRAYGLDNMADALKLQRDAAIACLPYGNQKQPMAVEAVGKTAGLLVLPGEGGTAEEQAEDMGFTLELMADGKAVAYQQLSDEAFGQSDEPQSEGEGK